MSSKLVAGDKVTINADHDYESNCAICAKPLNDNARWIFLGDGNILLTADEYSAIINRGGFAAGSPIGSSCVKAFDKEVVA
jgi:hypothetical protein